MRIPLCSSTTLLCLLLLLLSSAVRADVRFPADMGVVDVTQPPYNADKTGATDTTAAIQSAISALVGDTGSQKVLFFPKGTYKVSNTLDWIKVGGAIANRLTLQGENRTATIIKLADGSAGFGDPLARKPVIRTNSGKSGAAEAFRNYIRDLTVDTGSGNPGAVGIDFVAHNTGGILDVTVRSGAADKSGVRGIDIWRGCGPCLIRNVEVDGFDHGIWVDKYDYSLTLENISVKNQKVAGLRNTQNVLSILNFTSVNTVPALDLASGDGLTALLNASLTGGASTGPAVKLSSTSSRYFIRNAVASGYSSLIQGVSGLTVTEKASSAAYKTFAASPDVSLNLPILAEPTYFDTNFANWAKVDGVASDDTAAIQAAMNSGQSTVYFPAGTYTVNGTITVPASVRHVIGAESFIKPLNTSVMNNPANPVSVFKFTGGTAADFTIFERCRVMNGNSGTIWFEQATPRQVVIKHVEMGQSSSAIGIKTNPNNGFLFLSDLVTGRLSFEYDQRVFARQLNDETGSVKISNSGARLWILGLKTENTNTVLTLSGGSVTELVGGYFLLSQGSDTTNPGVLINGAKFSGSWAVGRNDYTIEVRETRAAMTVDLLSSTVLTRGVGALLPLYVAYDSYIDPGFGATLSPVADAYVRAGTSYANINYGLDTTLTVKLDPSLSSVRFCYIKFDLTSLAVPVTQARIVLPVVSVGTVAALHNAIKAASNWSETTLTYNNRPADLGLVLASWTPVAGADMVVDVTAAVQAAQNAAEPSITFRVYSMTSNASSLMTYGSRENSNPDLTPAMEINGGN